MRLISVGSTENSHPYFLLLSLFFELLQKLLLGVFVSSKT